MVLSRSLPSYRTLRLLTFVALSLAAASSPALAQSAAEKARAQMLVPSTWLAQHLKDPSLVLLHVGEKAEYEKTHIAGARFVSLDEIAESDRSDMHKNMLEMPKPDSLRARLARLGISDNSRVVVYYGKDWVTPSTRVILTLDYAGLGANSSLLDGGMPAWVAAGNAVTDATTPARTGTLSALKTKRLVVDADYVKASLGTKGISIVDGRSAAFYDGLQQGSYRDRSKHKAGHIAGAKSVPFSEITDEKLFVKSAAELEALFTKAGVAPGDTVVGYCHIGQQTTAMLFAARSLGHPVLIYDGSFEDWSRHDASYPVEATPAKKP